MKKTSLAIIIQKLYGGGAERAAANLSIALSGDFDIHLIVFDGSNIAYPHSGTLHDLKLPPVKSPLGKALNLFRRASAVRKIKKSAGVSASISLMMGANLVNVLSSIGEKTFPSVRNHTSSTPQRVRNGRVRLSERLKLQFLAKKATRIVAVAKGVEADLIANCGVPADRVATIYNMCDGHTILEKAASHPSAAQNMAELSITTMGRLDRQKGQWHLLRAFAKVLQTHPDAHLYLLGTGPLEQPLKSLASDLEIADHVHFPGFVESPHACIQKSRMFVLPSLFEGMSNTILEALNCATPCIATDCESGSREILAPGTGLPHRVESVEYAEFGILTAVGTQAHFNASDPLSEDEAQLAEAMNALIENQELHDRYRTRSSKRADDFSFPAIAKEWASLIRKA